MLPGGMTIRLPLCHSERPSCKHKHQGLLIHFNQGWKAKQALQNPLDCF